MQSHYHAPLLPRALMGADLLSSVMHAAKHFLTILLSHSQTKINISGMGFLPDPSFYSWQVQQNFLLQQ